MRLALPLRLTSRHSSWFVIVGLWITAVVFSTLQISFREAARGLRAPWDEVLAANALAWLPWLAIAPGVIWLERRFPVPGSRTGRHLAIHVGSAILFSTLFLTYLGYFHAAYLGGGGLLPSWALFRSELTEKLGEHFLVAVGLYAVIALGSFGYRTWSASRSPSAQADALPRSPSRRLGTCSDSRRTLCR